MVSCQKGHTCHAYAWQKEPFCQDTLVYSIQLPMCMQVQKATVTLHELESVSHHERLDSLFHSFFGLITKQR